MSLAALYLRVSTDEQKSSLDAQESGARLWCETYGHTVTPVCTTTQGSPALSGSSAKGSSPSRPTRVVSLRPSLSWVGP